MKVSPELPREFYIRDPLVVAKDLLGKLLQVETSVGPKSVIISETEAYIGVDDLASHASKGKTLRNQVMWETGGFVYIYFIYGMYEMLNIVVGLPGFPAAVLIRGGFPYQGVTGPVNGPGKLTRELEITRAHYGLDLVSNDQIRLFDLGLTPKKIHSSPRIGVDYARDWAAKPWRFFIDETPLSG